jgi:hypothetical protein
VHIAIDEYEAVHSTVQRYVDACMAADGDALRAALHPKWTMYGIDAGATDVAATVDEFVGWVKEQAPPDGYRATITHIEIAGDAAVATLVEESYYDTDYVVFFTLVRYESAWSVVCKTYSQIPPVRT